MNTPTHAQKTIAAEAEFLTSIAKEPLQDVDYLGKFTFAFGSELAVLRIFAHYTTKLTGLFDVKMGVHHDSGRHFISIKKTD